MRPSRVECYPNSALLVICESQTLNPSSAWLICGEFTATSKCVSVCSFGPVDIYAYFFYSFGIFDAEDASLISASS